MKKLGFGLMRLPLIDEKDPSTIDIEKVKVMADDFISRGFTYFDTAAPYHRGHSEIAFRRAVAERYPRNAYTVTDKLSMWMVESPDKLESFFEGQLERLGVDYVDYYLLHALDSETYAKCIEYGAFEFVANKKAEGKIRHVGFSFHDSAEVLDKILTEHPEMEYVQLQINYLDWEDDNIQSRKCYEVATGHEKPIIIMEPVKGGALANLTECSAAPLLAHSPDMSIASWAVRYAASPNNVVMVLSGMSNNAQMQDNLGYMEEFKPLSQEEYAIIEKVTTLIREDIAIPCTACRYCVDGCPKNIAIPEYFSIYNDYKRFNSAQKGLAKNRYKQRSKERGLASDCIDCGKCEKACPQHLSIRKHLADIAEEIEN